MDDGAVIIENGCFEAMPSGPWLSCEGRKAAATISVLFIRADFVPRNPPSEKRQVLPRLGRPLCLSGLSKLREKWRFPVEIWRQKT